MSRYHILAHKSEHKMVVGWDNPLESFWFHVYDAADEEKVISEFGSAPDEKCTNLVIFQDMVQPWGQLNAEVLRNLQADYVSRTEPSPLQKMMRRIFEDKP